MKALTLGVLAAAVLAVSVGSAKANLVTNGDFANGLDGWILDPVTTSGIDIQTSPDSTPPDGASAIFFSGDGALTQKVTTTSGGDYALSFSVIDEFAIPGDTFTVSFGDFTATIDGLDAAGGYTAESFLIPATDVLNSLTELSFSGSAQFADWDLAEVSLVPVSTPEPASGALLASFLAVAAVRRRKSASRRD